LNSYLQSEAPKLARGGVTDKLIRHKVGDPAFFTCIPGDKRGGRFTPILKLLVWIGYPSLKSNSVVARNFCTRSINQVSENNFCRSSILKFLWCGLHEKSVCRIYFQIRHKNFTTGCTVKFRIFISQWKNQ